MSNKRVAIIGLGRVAQLLEDDHLREKPCTHMGAYLNRPDVDVVAGVDIDEERLKAFGLKYGVSGLYSDYRKMLDDVRPDIVSITAYATERFEMLMASIEAGVKGIWCEKAFATSLDEADRIVEAAASANIPIIVSHMRRWDASYREVKAIIDSGELGPLKSISVFWSGSLLHTGTHAFDMLRFFAGDALWVEGETERNPTDDHLWALKEDAGGRATIGFEGGVYAQIEASTKKYFLFEFDLFFESGRLRIGNNEPLKKYKTGPSDLYESIIDLREVQTPVFDRGNIWIEALANLLEAMEGGENKNPPADGRAALEMALAVHKSSESGGARVTLPLKDRELTVRSR